MRILTDIYRAEARHAASVAGIDVQLGGSLFGAVQFDDWRYYSMPTGDPTIMMVHMSEMAPSKAQPTMYE